MNNPLIIIAVLVTFFVIAVVLQVFTLGRINENISLILRELDYQQHKLDNYMSEMKLCDIHIRESLSELTKQSYTLIRKLEEVIEKI